MNTGVYEHNDHPGHFYLLLGLARDHHTDEEKVVYIPLRTEPEWSGTARMALRPLQEFFDRFTFVGYRQP